MATPRNRQTFTNDGANSNVVSDNTRSFPTSNIKAGSTITVDNQKGGTQPSQAYYDKTAKMIANYRAGLNNNDNNVRTVYVNNDTGSGGGGGGGSYSGSSADDVINQIKALLSEQYEKAKASYQEMYNNANRQSEQAFENDRNQINRNYVRGNRYLRSLYGDRDEGYSQLNANNARWQSMLASARESKSTRDSNNTAQYNSNLANTANTLAQGWYNYILPFKVQDAQQARDYDFRKYLASL